MFPFAKRRLVGFDIGAYSVKVASFRDGGAGYTLEGAACYKLPKGGPDAIDTDPGLLSNIIAGLGTRKRVCAAALTGPSLVMRQLVLPRMPDEDLKEAVNWEMRKEASIPQDELVADYLVSEVKAEENKVPLIAFASRKRDSRRLVDLFSRAGLKLKAVDVVPGALFCAFDLNGEWEKGVSYAILDIGEAGSTLAIVKDSSLVFTRQISTGGREITSALSTVFNTGATEAEEYKVAHGLKGPDPLASSAISTVLESISSDLHRSFDYYQAQFREGPVSRVYISGGTARMKGLEDFMTEALGLKCFVDDPLRKVKIPGRLDTPALKSLSPCLTVAVGLAARTEP